MNRWKTTGYKAGQNMVCKVVAPEPGGYAVTVDKDKVPGFLPTDVRLRVGEEVLAQFVCVSNNRILLSARLSNANLTDSGKYKSPTANWEQQLNATGAPAGTEPEAAFQVWARNEPVNFKLRRAIDLILPAIGTEEKGNTIRMSDQYEDVDWLITDLEGGMRTGCVKAFCEPRKSRSAVLLYKGRAVGCIYGNKTLTEPQLTEPSLQMMLNDLQEPSTDLLMYDLPDNVTLAMSALFLGYPVERQDNMDAKGYIDYIGQWLHQQQQTACMAISTAQGNTCLVFVHRGQFAGCFAVEEQVYSDDVNFMYEFMKRDTNATVGLSILPPEMTSSSVKFGFSLSMAKKAAANSVLS